MSEKPLPLNKSNWFRGLLYDIALLISSIVLFTLAHPNIIYKWGFPPLAYVALAPLVILVHRAKWPAVFAYGALYGYLSYTALNFWLSQFSPEGFIAVPVIYMSYFIVIFPSLKLADSAFPNYSYLIQGVISIAYEFLKTKGYLGYPYGIIGYSQFRFIPLIQITRITGIWGLSLLVIFPGIVMGHGLRDKLNFSVFKEKRYLIPLLSWAGVFIIAITAGAISLKDFSDYPTVRFALTQQNMDPWRNGDIAYQTSLDINIDLSTQALEQDPDIVVWSETAFVPSILWHSKYRTNHTRFAMVTQLLDYLEKQDTPFIIGNNARDMGYNINGEYTEVSHNSAILMDGREQIQQYDKTHLVPFTEHFPFKKQLPRIYDMIQKQDIHFYDKGTEYTVFELDRFSLSTLICFEDSFGYHSRKMVQNGADYLVTMSNDLWAAVNYCAIQHLSMAIFRAVENQRTMVRATNGGVTCAVDPNGRLMDVLPTFESLYCITDAPLYTEKTTFYTKYEDWFARGCLILALGFSAAALALIVFRGYRRLWNR